MTTEEAIQKLKQFVDPAKPEWIEIIYGNAWEIHFMNGNDVVCEVKGHDSTLLQLIELILPEIQRYKAEGNNGSTE